MSAGVLLLTSAVFTFAAKGDLDSFLPWKIVVGLMAIGNIAAMGYTWRVNSSFNRHLVRAKDVLKRYWPLMYEIDLRYPHWWMRRKPKRDHPPYEVQVRQIILLLLHGVLVAASVFILVSPASHGSLGATQQSKRLYSNPAPTPSAVASKPQSPTTTPDVPGIPQKSVKTPKEPQRDQSKK